MDETLTIIEAILIEIIIKVYNLGRNTSITEAVFIKIIIKVSIFGETLTIIEAVSIVFNLGWNFYNNISNINRNYYKSLHSWMKLLQ